LLKLRFPLLPAWARVFGLALALLLPQLLGLLHTVAHDAAHGARHRSEMASHAGHPPTGVSTLTSLFDVHDEGSPDCRLYDQAFHDILTNTVAASTLPPVAPHTGVALFAGDALARWAAQFDARGPPLTS
jgi:hypothetical protein